MRLRLRLRLRRPRLPGKGRGFSRGNLRFGIRRFLVGSVVLGFMRRQSERQTTCVPEPI
jgi:hypothetical protein